MTLRKFVVTSGLTLSLIASAIPQTFAADAATSDIAAATSKATPTKKSVRAANRAFSKTVQKALFKTPGLERATISVFGNANTGRVTLAGQIDSQDQDALAVAAAKKVQGVTSVTSRLSLRPEGGA
ncbi:MULTISPECIES: BON domain-containing protein [Paraburkholderia]|uniref:BON domain-containing protein n=1 Tax=Paraburkholderia TaxID=1822464 RepID=UPI00048518FD|nr:BON domain-containing protein [Paraburkholderia caledonica]